MTEPGDPESEDAPDERSERAHIEDLDDGAGCTEIWEHLADRREE